MCPFALVAHPCPFDWNIAFASDTEIKGTSLSDFVAKFNEAVSKETKSGIARAIIYEAKPDSFRRIPEDSPYSKEMDMLFQRYVKVMEPLMKKGLGESAPIAISFPARIPAACLLAAEFSGGYGGVTNYEESKEGARLTRRRESLECRSYELSGKFLETVSEYQREERIAAGLEPASYVFARLSGMTWAFDIYSESAQDYVQESFLDGVALYVPSKQVILAIETREKHEEIAKVMSERGLLVSSSVDRMSRLKEAARTAGVQEVLVEDPMRRSELVKALQQRIEQGYFDEKAFKITLKRQDPPKAEFAEFCRSYLETRAKGFDRALLLASELGCVELVPLLLQRGDMEVLDFGMTYKDGKDIRAVKAIVAMGIKAAEPLFEIVEKSPNAQERYYALSALGEGLTAWKDDLNGKGLAQRMIDHCDTNRATVQLALGLLKGNIHDARTAAGADLESP